MTVSEIGLCNVAITNCAPNPITIKRGSFIGFIKNEDLKTILAAYVIDTNHKLVDIMITEADTNNVCKVDLEEFIRFNSNDQITPFIILILKRF